MRRVLSLSLALSLLAFVLFGCGGSSSGTPPMLTTPVINSLGSTTVAPGASLSILGAFFNGTFTTAFFFPTTGSASAQATATSGDTAEVTVTVPSTLAAGTYNVYVQTTNSSNNISAASNEVQLTVN